MAKTEGIAKKAFDESFFDTILKRRSRRFGLGMRVPEGDHLGPYKSEYDPIPLSEEEEALLVWAATGLTGMALAEISEAGSMVQWTGRSYPSPCNVHATELFYTNDDGLYLAKIRDTVADDVSLFEGLTEEESFERVIDLFNENKIKLEDGRGDLPDRMPALFDFNEWNANKPGTTLFVPITDTTLWYIDLLHLYFSRNYRMTLVDELNGRRPAGIQEWVDQGRLESDRTMGLFNFEQRVLTGLHSEQAMMCQNINLALQAMGLGGWSFTGFLPFYLLGGGEQWRGLGFDYIQPDEEKAMDPEPIPVGREDVFESYCPPNYDDMDEAVDAWIELKKKESGAPEGVPEFAPETTEIVKEACNYIYDTYGRLPAFIPPMYQRIQAQAHHIDIDFYDDYLSEKAYSDVHRNHFEKWHPNQKNPFK